MSQAKMFSSLMLASLILLAGLPTKAVADNHGAIAFSEETGAVGYSLDYESREAAEFRALEECGPGCKVVQWFMNACGALAIGDDNGWGTGWARDREQAERIALSKCGEVTRNCTLNQWVCTSR